VAAETLVRLGVSGTKWGPGFSPRAEKDAADEALAAVRGSELGPKALGSLSGGELQRVFLAEALVGNPEMLLLDEPLSNLDLRRSRDLVEVIHGLVRSRHVTTLLVAHDINPLIQCLDKVVYIANGNVATGPPEAVLTSSSLTELYGVPVEVLHDSRNNIVIVGGENPHEGEEE
jgi:zinc/manganese transport system ATP-binding protein